MFLAPEMVISKRKKKKKIYGTIRMVVRGGIYTKPRWGQQQKLIKKAIGTLRLGTLEDTE